MLRLINSCFSNLEMCAEMRIPDIIDLHTCTYSKLITAALNLGGTPLN